MNILEKIENRLTENKSSVKLYATAEAAQRTAIKENESLKKAHNTSIDCDFIVTYVPSRKKYTVIFQFSQWLQKYNNGAYLFYFSQRNFFSV